MKSKLVKQKEQTPQSGTSLDIDAILREKYANPAQPVAPLTVKTAAEPTARGPQQVQQSSAPRKRDVVRVSVDFPRALYNEVVAESDALEQTMREFMLTLVRQHFAQKRTNF